MAIFVIPGRVAGVKLASPSRTRMNQDRPACGVDWKNNPPVLPQISDTKVLSLYGGSSPAGSTEASATHSPFSSTSTPSGSV